MSPNSHRKKELAEQLERELGGDKLPAIYSFHTQDLRLIIEALRQSGPHSDALALLRKELQVDDHGDNVCGANPAPGWETGYCAGIRTAYRTLQGETPKTVAASEAHPLVTGDLATQRKIHDESEAGKDDAKDAQ